VFLLPTENGGAIRNQLLEAGLYEHKDFFYWDYQIYDEYMKEFERPVHDHVLIMGDCAFNHISMKDENKDSFGDMIKYKFGNEKCKVLSMHGIGQRAYHNIVNALIKKSEYPKLLILQIVSEVLTSKVHLMPRSQHAELIDRILKASHPTDELIEYARLTKERFGRFQVETYTAYDGNESDNNAKLYMKMNYMFTLKETTEGVIYLIKTIKLMNSLHIPVTLYIPPVNYIFGEKCWGESFLKMYKKIFEDLWQFLKDFKFDILDASFLLEIKDFAASETIDESAKYQGRLKLLDFFENSGVFK
jgi:hypothetical protein